MALSKPWHRQVLMLTLLALFFVASASARQLGHHCKPKGLKPGKPGQHHDNKPGRPQHGHEHGPWEPSKPLDPRKVLCCRWEGGRPGSRKLCKLIPKEQECENAAPIPSSTHQPHTYHTLRTPGPSGYVSSTKSGPNAPSGSSGLSLSSLHGGPVESPSSSHVVPGQPPSSTPAVTRTASQSHSSPTKGNILPISTPPTGLCIPHGSECSPMRPDKCCSETCGSNDDYLRSGASFVCIPDDIEPSHSVPVIPSPAETASASGSPPLTSSSAHPSVTGSEPSSTPAVSSISHSPLESSTPVTTSSTGIPSSSQHISSSKTVSVTLSETASASASKSASVSDSASVSATVSATPSESVSSASISTSDVQTPSTSASATPVEPSSSTTVPPSSDSVTPSSTPSEPTSSQVPTPTPSCDSQVIRDPSFEENGVWELYSSGGTISLSGVSRRSGQQSAYVAPRSGADTSFTISQQITLCPGSTYNFEAFAMQYGPSMCRIVYSMDGVELVRSPALRTGYVPVTAQFSAGERTTALFAVTGTCPPPSGLGFLSFDDITLTVVQPETPPSPIETPTPPAETSTPPAETSTPPAKTPTPVEPTLVPPSVPTQIVQNSGFESLDNFAWTTTNVDGVFAEVTSEFPRSGLRALRIRSTTGVRAILNLSQTFGIQPGQQYQVDVRYAVTSSLARPCNFDALLASQRFSLTTPTPNTGYETSNFTFNSGPRTSGTLVVRMSCANTDPDFPTTLYLDDITVTLIGPS